MSAAGLHHQIRLLELELIDADEVGPMACDRYRRDLEQDLATCRVAFVGAAVSEIAALRAQLSGPLLG